MKEIITVNRKDAMMEIYKINDNFEIIDCTRPNLLQNPMRLKVEKNRNFVINEFRKYLWKQMQQDTPVRRELKRLAASDKAIVLTCVCKPKPCHTDIIKKAIEWIRQNPSDKRIN